MSLTQRLGKITVFGRALTNKLLWMGVGGRIFILIRFILPTPQSVVEVVEKYGFAKKMIYCEVAYDVQGAA